MAAVAEASETAVMNVVIAVAGDALRAQIDLAHIRPRVAGLTSQSDVSPFERVVGIAVVVEAPDEPAVRVVASGAVRGQSPTVCVGGRVAAGAAQRRVRVRTGEMTLLTRCEEVKSDQWEP